MGCKDIGIITFEFVERLNFCILYFLSDIWFFQVHISNIEIGINLHFKRMEEFEVQTKSLKKNSELTEKKHCKIVYYMWGKKWNNVFLEFKKCTIFTLKWGTLLIFTLTSYQLKKFVQATKLRILEICCIYVTFIKQFYKVSIFFYDLLTQLRTFKPSKEHFRGSTELISPGGFHEFLYM